MTNQHTELDELLTRFADGEYSEHWTDGRRTCTKSEAKQAILDWHNKQVLEIISEDEPPEGLTSWYDGIERDSTHREGRNMLREWQRNKLKESSNDQDS